MADMVRFVLCPSIKLTFLLYGLSVLGFTCPYFHHYLIVAIVLIMPLGYLTPLSYIYIFKLEFEKFTNYIRYSSCYVMKKSQ